MRLSDIIKCMETSCLDLFRKLVGEKTIAYSAVQTMGHCIKNSKETTTTGLTRELAKVKKDMLELAEKENLLEKTTLSLISAINICEHMLYKDMSMYQKESMQSLREKLASRVKQFAEITLSSRKRAVNNAKEFIRDGQTILTHGYSKLVEEILLSTAEDRRFKVIVTESRPRNFGKTWKAILDKKGIPNKVILDGAIGSVIPDVDYLLVGAEAVLQNGGIVNHIGTLSAAMCAKSFKKPCYVAVECLKFLNIFPLSIKDFGFAIQEKVGEFDNPLVDFTPPEYITLLFTDVGTFTPSAVSDELIQFYHT